MNSQLADYLVHFANILLLVSYSVRDILWLRWFAVAAALTQHPLLPPSGDRALATGSLGCSYSSRSICIRSRGSILSNVRW